MITPAELREQAKAHREAARKLEAAADTLENLAQIPCASKEYSGIRKRVRIRIRPSGFVMSEGIRKNQELAYQVLKKAGQPLAVRDLLRAMRSLGSTISNTDTVTVYLRHDENKRFFRPELGMWAITTKMDDSQ